MSSWQFKNNGPWLSLGIEIFLQANDCPFSVQELWQCHPNPHEDIPLNGGHPFVFH